LACCPHVLRCLHPAHGGTRGTCPSLCRASTAFFIFKFFRNINRVNPPSGVVREHAKSVELDGQAVRVEGKGGESGARRVGAPPWRCSARCHFPSCRCVRLPARCACLSLGVASPGACGVSSHNLAGTQPFLLAAPGRRGTWTRAAQGREDKHGAASARDRSPPPARCIPHCATRGSGGRV